MDLKSGFPFWSARDGFLETYDPLDRSLTTDVVIIGAGITGALLANALVDAGFECVVVDRRNAASGSTCASTALLQYEIDTHLTDLAATLGESQAVLAYKSCRDAVSAAEQICRVAGTGDFQRRESVYFASRPGDVEALREDFELRLRHGLAVAWIDAREFSERFDFEAQGAILSHAAQIDPHLLAHGLLQGVASRGNRIFARTDVVGIDEFDSGVILTTDRDAEIRARFAVVAGGYESPKFLKRRPKIALHSTYAIASEPLRAMPGWPGECLLWESARPYSYARTTSDRRGILGGEDVDFKDEQARDALLPKKVDLLSKRWKAFFPRIPLEIACEWTGTFAETPDGLPYIGFPKDQPRTFFALCYGGNGIIFSVIAGAMLLAALEQRRHPCHELFGFER